MPGAAEDPVARLETLAHDLRTPLAIIAGFSELLLVQDAQLAPERRREYLERMRAAAVEMGGLLDAERAERQG